MRQNKKAGWHETLKLHIKCLRDVYRCSPRLIWAMMFHDIFFAANPFLIVYLSAKIVNELTGLCRIIELRKWIIVAIVCESFVMLIKALLNCWEKAEQTLFNVRHEKEFYTTRILTMDYSHLDNQKINDKLSQIEQTRWSGGWGINRAIYYIDVLFSACVGIFSASFLTVSLFTSKIPDSAAEMVFLSHPVTSVMVLILMICIILLSACFEVKALAEWAKTNDSLRFGNRCCRVYSNFCSSRERAADIRLFNQHNIAQNYIKKTNTYGPNEELARKERGVIGWCSAFSEGLSAAFIGLVYMFVGLKSYAGAFGAGMVTQYIGAFSMLFYHLSRFVQAIGNMQSNTPFLRTIYDFLDISRTVHSGCRNIKGIVGDDFVVEFKNVSFRYPNNNTWALKNVSFKINAGKRVAIVGENGCGKTTLIKLLCRLYVPQEGQILLNGIDIQEINYQDYMNLISVVFQDYQLLSQPLCNNVAGCKEYDADRVRECLIEAGLADRLQTLPSGIETILYKDFSGDGIEVSGGEAQKIAIARALYKNTPMIILDEPTAAMDPIAEEETYKKFKEITNNKTVVFISHRLSSTKFCDEVIVLKDGYIIEFGKHTELLKKERGVYRSLWDAQAQYYSNSDTQNRVNIP